MKLSQMIYQLQQEMINSSLPVSGVSLIVEYILGKPSHELLISNPELEETQIKQFEKISNKIVTEKIPIAHVVGFEYFYNRKFIVSNKCLIPRIESEELVYNTIENIRSKYVPGSKISICDICTGSGIIGISIYLELISEYEITLYLSDISSDALDICSKNVEKFSINASVVISDCLETFIGNEKFDIVVANPPYIPNEEFLENIVVDYEPHIALFGGVDGLQLYYKIIEQLPGVLKEDSIVAFEIGDGQADAISSYLNIKFENAKILKFFDMFERERNIIMLKE